jgi:hypothetical protein
MRHVFLALLMANLGYAAWVAIRLDAPASLDHMTAAPAYQISLSLVRESLTAGLDLPQTNSGLNDDTGHMIESEPSLDPSAAQANKVIDANAENLAAQEDMVALSPLAQSAAPTQVADDKLQYAADGSSAPMELSCVRVGPFATNQDASRVLGMLATHLYEAGIETEAIPAYKVFWVHLPAYASRAQAKSQVRSLQARGIDSFVIDEPGPLKNGVSLGVFRDGDASLEMQRRMAGAGLPAAIHQIQRYRSSYHIEGVAKDRETSDMHAVLLGDASSAIISVMECPPVAPQVGPN